MTAPTVCQWGPTAAGGKCDRPARMAVKVTRPTRGDLRVTAYADDRTAPKTAVRYCRTHGLGTVRDLLVAVVDCDEDEAAEAAR